ncbi:hypothetical protein FN846DRAFT_887664 [Sphaerosporella brunnea]|uniref:Uncharacterized protein n=1 Tax=Sphaerosporella brunnea TaxID=1250544 RepID=A0A5J5F4Y9_9PEZI|nr:hypothetical protein FN846DRAFT_887664 [Sphaerosporella brunnea]
MEMDIDTMADESTFNIEGALEAINPNVPRFPPDSARSDRSSSPSFIADETMEVLNFDSSPGVPKTFVRPEDTPIPNLPMSVSSPAPHQRRRLSKTPSPQPAPTPTPSNKEQLALFTALAEYLPATIHLSWKASGEALTITDKRLCPKRDTIEITFLEGYVTGVYMVQNRTVTLAEMQAKGGTWWDRCVPLRKLVLTPLEEFPEKLFALLGVEIE